MRYAASVSATSVATSCYAPSPTAYAALAAAFPSPLSVTTRAAASIVTTCPTTITRSWFPTVRSSLHYSSHWRPAATPPLAALTLAAHTLTRLASPAEVQRTPCLPANLGRVSSTPGTQDFTMDYVNRLRARMHTRISGTAPVMFSGRVYGVAPTGRLIDSAVI